MFVNSLLLLYLFHEPTNCHLSFLELAKEWSQDVNVGYVELTYEVRTDVRENVTVVGLLRARLGISRALNMDMRGCERTVESLVCQIVSAHHTLYRSSNGDL